MKRSATIMAGWRPTLFVLRSALREHFEERDRMTFKNFYTT